MEAQILEFIGDLRRAEVRVSPTESLDAIRAAAEVGVEDRETFQSALAATLVKDARDLPVFNRLFDLYFLDLEALGQGLREAMRLEDPWVRALAGEIELDPLSRLLFFGDGASLELAIRGGAQGAGLERLFYFLQVGLFSRRIADSFDWSQVEADLQRLLQALAARGLGEGELARVQSYLELRLEAFRRMIREHVEREVSRRAMNYGERVRRESLSEKPLFVLTPDEVARMKGVVARLAARIKDALVLRQRLARRGALDGKRTFRKNLQYQGLPLELEFRRRRRDRPKLVTLCDVSDSVRNASRFMLQLVWSLQECFAKVRSFVFVSEIADITQALARDPVDQALDYALRRAPVDYGSRSDFGYAFARFCREQLDTLDRKTTLLILGDARSNYHDPQLWTLKLLRERVKGIIWLNPEGTWGWGVGDSVMPLYAPHCDLVRECRTVAQLAQAVDRLVQGWWRVSLR